MEQFYDALVIGGGPGGSTAATFLARANRKVLVLEKDNFPRFHLGESLLPYNNFIFEEMGVLGKLHEAGFPRKFGAQFHLGNGKQSVKLVFKNGRFTRASEAMQVERAKFDTILLNHAVECGAEARQGWEVTNCEEMADEVSLSARDSSGKTETFRGAFLVDASGRANFTGNRQKLRVQHDRFRKVAVFGHFTGVFTDEGPASGDTIIVRLEDKWFWIIPIGTKVSVGCVLDTQEFSNWGKTPGEVFDAIVKSSTEMRRRMTQAQATGPVQATSDFSYYNRSLVSARTIRVGDAAGFLDPIFSVGVYLAMHSGKLAANAISKCRTDRTVGGAQFRKYERHMFAVMKSYWSLVEQFYTTPFMELFFKPNPRWQIPDALVAILAGEIEGGWRIATRRMIFSALVRLQSRFELVPKLCFDETEPVTMK